MSRTLTLTAAALLCAALLLPVAVIVLCLAAFVWMVRAGARLVEPRFVPWTELMQFDRALGWRPRPNLNAHYLAELDDVFRMITDAEGWPGRRPLDRSAVVVVGDSFAAGYGVDAHRTFAELHASLPVKAVGAPGYSMVHGVLLMEELAARLSGKLVVWFVYPENDLQDNLAPEMRGYRAPFLRLSAASGSWEIVTSHVAPGRWNASRSDVRRLLPRFCVPGPLADRAYAAAGYLIGRAGAACERAGARLVVVSIPHPMQLTAEGVAEMARLSGEPGRCDAGLPDRRLGELCRLHRVPLLRASDRLNRGHYKVREGIHWNERGHRQMARLIDELYRAFRSGSLDRYLQGDTPQGLRALRPEGSPHAGSPAANPAAAAQ
jgi:hypothetical protein